MEITASYTLKDGIRAHRYVTRRMFKGTAWQLLPVGWNFLCWLVLGMGGMLLYKFSNAYRGPDSEALALGLWLLLAGVLALASTNLLNRLVSQKVAFRSNGYFFRPKSFLLSDKGLVQRSQVSEEVIDWSAIESIEEDASHLYFFIDRGAAIYIPKQAFSDAKSIQDFLSAAKQLLVAAKG